MFDLEDERCQMAISAEFEALLVTANPAAFYPNDLKAQSRMAARQRKVIRWFDAGAHGELPCWILDNRTHAWHLNQLLDRLAKYNTPN